MTSAVETVAVRRRRASAPTRAWAFVRRHTLTLFAILSFLYLLLPIAVVIIFSFNDPIGRFNFTWQGFTLRHWQHPFTDPDLSTIDSLARVALACRREGIRMLLVHPSPALRTLVTFAGLEEVLWLEDPSPGPPPGTRDGQAGRRAGTGARCRGRR